MKLEIQLLILFLNLSNLYETCKLSGENCVCFTIPIFTDMKCGEKYSIAKILNFNETEIYDKVPEIRIRLENKIYDRITSSYENVLLKMVTLLTFANCQILKLYSNSFIGMDGLNDLYLNSNKIISIQKNSFYGLLSLISLYLYSNDIDFIEMNAFQGLNSLTILYLNLNKLKYVQKDTFNNLLNLTVLKLNENLIEIIETNSFLGLVNLETLYLDKNSIKLIKSQTFASLNKLLTLNLKGNQIEFLEMNAFESLDRIEYLYLYSNKLKLIKNGVLNHMKKLKELWLNGNQVELIEKNSFLGLESLEVLYLQVNQLESIQNETFSNLKSLKVLCFHENRLILLENEAFKGLTKLEILRLDFNFIKFINEDIFENLTSLKTLQIGYNEVKSLNKHLFGHLINQYQTFSLKSNKIEQIETGTFRNLLQLTKIDLSQNRLNKIEKYSFQNLPSLYFCDLSHNYLDQLIDVFDENVTIQTLDLSFNLIKILENSHGFKLLNLHLYHNGLKLMKKEFFKGNILSNIESFYLGLNELSYLEKFLFNNKTKRLYLNSNKFQRINSLSLSHLRQLELLDLSNNQIQYVDPQDFSSCLNLKTLNLSKNQIIDLNSVSFSGLVNLESLKISNNSLELFDMSILNSSKNILDLDLSFNNLSYASLYNLKNIQTIKLVKVKFVTKEKNFYETLLNENLRELDFSQNDLSDIFDKFSIMKNLETLILREVNLKRMEQIKFSNFRKLKILDLSFNNLTYLFYVSFQYMTILEYLDLSFNQIEFIDGRIFGDWGDFKQKPLRYLNLKSNRIKKFETSLFNLNNLYDLILTCNELNAFPSFKLKIANDISIMVNSFYLNENKIKFLAYLPFEITTLVVLNFDSNEISSIERNTFQQLKNLQNLSISNNFITNITEDIFFYQFSLKFLNLSYNRIEFIEMNSFENLNELKMLDLSFNRLYSIESDIFNGLSNLNDLYLLNNFTFSLYNHSFNHLTNISGIYLARTMIVENKCIFMHSIERAIKRNVANGTYKFYKSINLISNDSHVYDEKLCELTLEFLQFKIHLNLKTDYENEIFYEKCKTVLISQKNNFNHSYQKCFQNFQVVEILEKSEETDKQNSFVVVLGNGFYLFTVIVLFLFFVPFFVIIYLNIFYFNDWC